jgi:hypothetical protein
MLRAVLVTLGASLISIPILIAAFYYWSEIIEPRSCDEAQKIRTSEQAIEFAKPLMRAKKYLWNSVGVVDENEIAHLVDLTCCTVNRGDYAAIDSHRWGVGLPSYEFQYEIFFSECGKNVREDILSAGPGRFQDRR